MSHYLVTGGAGFIGTNIVKRLKKDGHKVRVLDNFSAGKKEENLQEDVEYLEGDIRSLDDLAKAMEGIEGVFHHAAMPRVSYTVEHPIESNEHNLTGTINVLKAAKDAGVKRVIFATSSAVYGTDEPVSVKEDAPKNPQSPYALQKLAGQEYCKLFSKLYGLETVSLCYFNIYGPHMDPAGAYALVIGRFLLLKSQGKPLTISGDGEYYRDYVHVSDVVEANILTMESDKVGHGEVLNIGHNLAHSVNDLAKMIGGPTVSVDPRPGDPRYARADNARAKELLGWVPKIKLEDGVNELKKDWGVE